MNRIVEQNIGLRPHIPELDETPFTQNAGHPPYSASVANYVNLNDTT